MTPAKRIKYAAIYLPVRLLFVLFAALPLDTASSLGGWLGRRIGPRLRQHTVAGENLAFAFPHKTQEERDAIRMKMWDHLGRIVGEMAHFPGNGLYERVSVANLHHLPHPDAPCIFISGHFGQWELTYPVPYEHGIPVLLVYRHVNNPYIENMLAKLRASHATSMVQKGLRGAVKMAKAIRAGQSLAIMVDQKMNEGVPISFFGRDAMTAPAFAQLALRYNLPIIPARVLRTEGAHFKGEAFPALQIERSGNEEEDIRRILIQVNAMLERWIRECPEQWFWIHRRWGKDVGV